MDSRFLRSSIAWLETLPERLRSTVVGVAGEILDGYPDTLSIVVIGSVAEGVYDDVSDVDMLYVREEKIPNEVIVRIKETWPLAQFIVRTPGKLLRELQEGSIAAWSVKRGVVLYDPQRVIRRSFRQEPRLPSGQWILQRLEYVTSWPSDVEGLRKKLLNLGVLMLARRGVVVTTKHQLRHDFPRHIRQPLLCMAIDFATMRQPSARGRYVREARMLAEAVAVLARAIRV